MAAQAATRLTAPDRTAQLQDNAQPSCRTHPPCAAPTTSSIFAHLPRQAPAAGSLAACQVGSCSSSLRRAANSNTTASKLTFRAVKRDRIEEQPPMTGSARRGSTCPSPLSHAGLSMSRRPASAACATKRFIIRVVQTLPVDGHQPWLGVDAKARHQKTMQSSHSGLCDSKLPWPWEHSALETI